jgi:hypothetical protein
MTDVAALLESYANENAPEYYETQDTWLPADLRSQCAPKAFTALRAVIRLHSPAPGRAWCLHCSGDRWPCPTIRKLVEALGGVDGQS